MTTRPHLLTDSHEAQVVDECAELRKELKALRAEVKELREGFERDRNQVAAIFNGLRAALGGNAEAAATSNSPLQPPNDAVWGMWKSRLPGACPKVIDALLIQPLTATQLISATGTSHSTIQRAINVLEGNSLIERDGARIRLKRL